MFGLGSGFVLVSSVFDGRHGTGEQSRRIGGTNRSGLPGHPSDGRFSLLLTSRPFVRISVYTHRWYDVQNLPSKLLPRVSSRLFVNPLPQNLFSTSRSGAPSSSISCFRDLPRVGDRDHFPFFFSMMLIGDTKLSATPIRISTVETPIRRRISSMRIHQKIQSFLSSLGKLPFCDTQKWHLGRPA